MANPDGEFWERRRVNLQKNTVGNFKRIHFLKQIKGYDNPEIYGLQRQIDTVVHKSD